MESSTLTGDLQPVVPQLKTKNLGAAGPVDELGTYDFISGSLPWGGHPSILESRYKGALKPSISTERGKRVPGDPIRSYAHTSSYKLRTQK